MVQAHKGYFKESGQFVFDNYTTHIPHNLQVIVLWDDELKENRKQLLTEREAAQFFLTGVQKLRKELTLEDKAALDELENGKYKPIYEDRSSEL